MGKIYEENANLFCGDEFSNRCMVLVSYRIGIDIGGTFTDVVAINEDSGELFNLKLPSTPSEPEKGVLQGMKEFSERFPGANISVITHATTIAANSLVGQIGLEPPKVSLVTTYGFRDIIEIGRQRRPELYNFFFRRPRTLVPRELRFEVQERIGPRGEVWEPLNENSVRDVVQKIENHGVGSVAICLLHSYANPAHERQLADKIRGTNSNIHVSTSYEVAPEYREYERTSTTVVNAYTTPIVSKYIEGLEKQFRKIGVNSPFLIMQSDGGLTSGKTISVKASSLIESGPAAGVVASSHYARILGIENVISFDMGGTTAKAGVVKGYRPEIVYEYEVGGKIHSGRVVKGSGYPVKAAFIDLAECSAGGGTVAWVDEAGSLRVGPLSMGARPGPACYGLGGDKATITDANLLLGRLNEKHLLGGRMSIYSEAAAKALEKLGEKLGLAIEEVSSGIIRIANSEMSKIMKIVSIERGHDPRKFSMMTFGGAGPMHACALAEELGVQRVFVPPNPGLFSALGLLFTDLSHMMSRTLLIGTTRAQVAKIRGVFDELENQTYRKLTQDGASPQNIVLRREIDMRYKGQSYELTVDFSEGAGAETISKLEASFHQEHESIYGYSSPDAETEIVNVRVRGTGSVPKPTIRKTGLSSKDPSTDSIMGERNVYFEEDSNFHHCKIYSREKLRPGNQIDGPCVVEQYDATTVVYPGWKCNMDEYSNLVLGRV